MYSRLPLNLEPDESKPKTCEDHTDVFMGHTEAQFIVPFQSPAVEFILALSFMGYEDLKSEIRQVASFSLHATVPSLKQEQSDSLHRDCSEN